MRFNLKIQDLLSTGEIKTTPKEQDLGSEEELSDEEATTISGGRWTVISASTSSTFSLSEYYKYAGFWGG